MPRKKTPRREPRKGEQELLRQIHVAGEQLDAHEGGRLGWVVSFVRENPAAWLPGEHEAHGWRLLALVFRIPRNMIGGTSVYPLTRREVEGFHAELRRFLHDVVSVPPGNLVTVPTDGLTTVLLRASRTGEKPASFAFSRGGPFRTMLFQEVAELVRDSDRLIACPVCDEPFLALRKKKFCTPKCTQRWWDREKVKAKQKGVG